MERTPPGYNKLHYIIAEQSIFVKGNPGTRQSGAETRISPHTAAPCLDCAGKVCYNEQEIIPISKESGFNMKRKSIIGRILGTALIALTAASLTLPASAENFSSGSCGESLTYSISADGVFTLSGSGAMYDYKRGETPWEMFDGTIRKVVAGNEVTRIGTYAFYDCMGLSEVVLGTGTESVGAYAFYGCEDLITLTLGDDTAVSASSSFRNTALTTVILRSSVTDIPPEIRDFSTVTAFEADNSDGIGYYDTNGILYCFADDGKTETTTLVKVPEGKLFEGTFTPESDTDILGENALRHQTLLTGVILPQSVTKIGEWALYGCTSLTEFTPGDASDCVDNTFGGNVPLRTVHLRSSVTSLADSIRDLSTVLAFDADNSDGMGYYDIDGVLYHYANDGETETTTFVKLPTGKLCTAYTVADGTDIIGDSTFRNHEILGSVKLPDSVKNIGAFAMDSCPSLKEITLQSNAACTKSTFSGSNLRTVFLSDSVTSLDDDIRDLDTLTAFEVRDTDGGGFYDVNGILYFCDDESKILVKIPESMELSGSFTAEVGTTHVGKYAFCNLDELSAVYLPVTFHTFAENAFYSCDKLIGIYFYGKPPAKTYPSSLPDPEDVILYYVEGTEGWTDPWNGYDTAIFIPGTPNKGDVNEDGTVDSNDSDIFSRIFAGMLRRFRKYFTNICANNSCDFNGDGVISRRDAMILSRYLAGWEDCAEYFQ